MRSATEDLMGERASAAGLEILPSLSARLAAYYDLLVRWNQKINLTSLSDPASAIDRLLLEPLLAARSLPQQSRLMDLGSGGGSPAIPLALALDAPLLVMVESRTRKAAFLREAARAVEIKAVVEADRFERIAQRPDYRASMDVVSVRAVRMDEATMDIAESLARPGGWLALFTSEPASIGETIELIGRAKLVKVSVPRGTSGSAIS